MSLHLLRKEIFRFLSNSTPEVVCITGKWGVGKTFAWEVLRKEALEQPSGVAIGKYSYVSLFGRNSLDDVRAAIVENVVDSRDAAARPSWKNISTLNASTLRDIAQNTGSRLQRSFFGRMAGIFPVSAPYSASIARLLYLNMSSQIVCLDDLERAGKELSLRVILGLVSSLKVDKGCKVIIILNSDALDGDAASEFGAQLEKVADAVIGFEPTPEECAEIGVQSVTNISRWIQENSISLKIKNIRTIQKAQYISNRISELLSGFDERLLKSAIHTTVLAVYSKFQPSDAPPLSYIAGFKSLTYYIMSKEFEKKGEKDPNRHHAELLMSYGFSHVDTLDLAIIESIQNNLLNAEKIIAAANDIAKTLNKSDHTKALQRAWSLYHNSFQNNVAEVCDAIECALCNGITEFEPVEFGQSVSLLIDLGRVESARDLLKKYGENNFEKIMRSAQTYGRMGVKFHPEVMETYRILSEKRHSPRSIQEALERLHKGDWDKQDEDICVSLSEDDFYKLFKETTLDSHAAIIGGALSMMDVGSPPGELAEMTKRAKAALWRISAESLINQRRVEGRIGPAPTPDESSSENEPQK